MANMRKISEIASIKGIRATKIRTKYPKYDGNMLLIKLAQEDKEYRMAANLLLPLFQQMEFTFGTDKIGRYINSIITVLPTNYLKNRKSVRLNRTGGGEANERQNGSESHLLPD